MTLKKKILVVDDEPYILRVLKMKLERGGYNVDTAINGVDALKKLDKEKPSVFITDINMPLMGGRELCQFLEQHREENDLLTIVMTSDIDRANRIWADQMKNTVFVEKPFSPRNILKIIEEYFLQLQGT